MSGLIFNGNGDVIRAVDGSLTVEGLDFGGGNIEAGIGTFTTLNVTGVLTYEDVKNVDSVGIVTAREGIFLPDNKKVQLGNAAGTADLEIYHSSSTNDSFIVNGTGDLELKSADHLILKASINDNAVYCIKNDAVELYWDGTKKFETTKAGTATIGIHTATESGTGNGMGGISAATANGGGNAGYGFKTNNVNRFAVTTIGSAGAESLRVYDDNNNAERLRITSGGIVNIGSNTNSDWISSVVKVRKDQNAVTRVAIRNEDQGSSASSAFAINAYGNSWTLDCGSAAKNSNAFTINVDATSNSNQGTEKFRITTDGKVAINRAGATPAEKLEVGGSVALIGGSLKLDTHPLVTTASFSDISGGTYAARLGSTGTSTIRSTQIYGGGGHIATFDGVNKRLGINITAPLWEVHAQKSSGTTTIGCKNTGGNASVYVEASNTNTAKLELTEAGTGSYSLQVGNDNALMFFDDSVERMRIDTNAKVGINTTTFEHQGVKLKIDGRGAGTTSATILQIKGNGTGVVHAALDLIATSDNNGSGGYRGLGVFMYDEVDTHEWYAGVPYTNADSYIIGRKSNPSYRQQSGELANNLFKIRSDGKLQIGNVAATSTYLANTNAPKMDVWGYGTVYPTLRLGTIWYQAEGEGIRFGRTDHGDQDIRYHSIIQRHDSTGTGNYLQFRIHDAGSSPYQSQKTTLHIDGRGHVGINETSPDGPLHVTHAGENNVYIEGNTSTLGSRIMLINRNTTANSFNQLEFCDAGGQGTSLVRGVNVLDGSNEGSLELWTRPANGSSTKQVTVTASGEVVKRYYKSAQNGVQRYRWGGYVASNVGFSRDIPVLSSGNIYNIKAYFTHYSGGYGAYLEGVYGAYSGHNGMQLADPLYTPVTSGHGGSWTITRGNAGQPVVVTKVAGTYAGAGYWFIDVIAGTT